MKSAFGSKRKARKIQVDDEDDGGANDSGKAEQSTNSRKYSQWIREIRTDPRIALSSAINSNATNKPFKKSSLRKSINFDDIKQDEDVTSEDGGNRSHNRPSTGKSNFTARKKKPASSRLSFGPGEIISGDAAEALEDEETFTPKKAIGRRIVEKSSQYDNLVDDEERPTYSKGYLDELKSSTPTSMALVTADDELGLDELEGAMIIDLDSKPSYIPSEAEIREKKERRARLAHEEDFISLNDDGGRDSELSLVSRKKKPESRLVREDEDLGEGFDEFVEDGRIALGKKQERAAKRKHRKEMAEMINQAEGSSNEDSDDSEAERRIAYEEAQTRAGMDGLHKPTDDLDDASIQMPTKITPLPGLAESLENFKITLNDIEQDMVRRQKHLEDLNQEKEDILVRELEVQELLKQAGARYSAMRPNSIGTEAVGDVQEVIDAHDNGLPSRTADRGLESFGNTPTTRPAFEDVN